jgi:hypothetical protein
MAIFKKDTRDEYARAAHCLEVSHDLHRKAEACRRLADLSEDDERKSYWIKKAVNWDRLAKKPRNTPSQHR